MPHLQEKNEAEATSQTINRSTPKRESEGLPIMAATEKQSQAVGRDSYDSDESEQESSSRNQVITPSPYANSSSPLSPKRKQGPLLSIFGSTRLFSSPIRVKKRVSVDEEEKKNPQGEEASDGQELGQPKNLRYGRKQSLPTAKSLSFDKIQKRQLEQTEPTSTSKKAKTELPENTKSQAECTPVPKKKPIISPASSAERVDDDESTGTLSRGASYPFRGGTNSQFHHRYPHYPPPHHHAYGGPYSPYGPGYPMYSGYANSLHPHAHFGAPPSAYYPPYPPRHNMMSPFRSAPRGLPTNAPMGMAAVKKSTGAQRQVPRDASSSGRAAGQAKDSAIASVAEWQRAAVADGSPPSAKRCVPLTEPIPSKFWGESNAATDMKLPDFHRLVNFPDYLAKSRNSSSDASTAPEGKKNCVMCGKQRFCSVSSLVNKGRFVKREGDEDGPDHIIPRQNKGLCTACDVTVWVVTDDGLEIKWCKGCKNFRPWVAFGDKGSATKCVRCRDRQREKYAMQKDEIKLRRYKQTGSPDSASKEMPESSKWDDRTVEEEHLAAANGLRNLIHAATTN